MASARAYQHFDCHDTQAFVRLKIAPGQNVLVPEMLADGFGGVDVKRLIRSINQIGEGFKFTHKPKVDGSFDAAYLPPKAEHTIKQ